MFKLVFMLISDYNVNENNGPFLKYSLKSIQRVRTDIPTVSKGDVIFCRRFKKNGLGQEMGVTMEVDLKIPGHSMKIYLGNLYSSTLS